MKPLNQITTDDIIQLAKEVSPKTWIKIGIGAAIFAAIYFLILDPAWFKLGVVKTKITALETQIVNLKNAMRKKPEWVKNKDDYKRFIEESKKRIYAPGESSLLLGVISKMAEDSKVSIIASKPKPFESKFPAPFDQQYEGNAYDFTVEGGYHEVAGFVSKIESAPKLLRVHFFSIAGRDELPKSHLVDLSLTAVSIKERKT